MRLYRHDTTARSVGFGRYLGPLEQTPHLSTSNAPKMSSGTLTASICEIPEFTNGFLLIGLSCTPELPLPTPWFLHRVRRLP